MGQNIIVKEQLIVNGNAEQHEKKMIKYLVNVDIENTKDESLYSKAARNAYNIA